VLVQFVEIPGLLDGGLAADGRDQVVLDGDTVEVLTA
jgi:hypothetical protein